MGKIVIQLRSGSGRSPMPASGSANFIDLEAGQPPLKDFGKVPQLTLMPHGTGHENLSFLL